MTFQPTFTGFPVPSRYPHEPGASGEGVTLETSKEAAEAIKPITCRLRRVVLETLDGLQTATSLEIVDHSGFLVDSIRPRISELRVMGLVEPTGERRKNPSGKSAAVLRLTDAGRAALNG